MLGATDAHPMDDYGVVALLSTGSLRIWRSGWEDDAVDRYASLPFVSDDLRFETLQKSGDATTFDGLSYVWGVGLRGVWVAARSYDRVVNDPPHSVLLRGVTGRAVVLLRSYACPIEYQGVPTDATDAELEGSFRWGPVA